MAELEEELTLRGYDKARIAEMTDRLRSDLLARDEPEKEGERDREIEQGKLRRIEGKQHRLIKARGGGGKFRDAFGVDRQYQEGDFLKRMKKNEGQVKGSGGRDEGGEVACERLKTDDSVKGRTEESNGAQMGMKVEKGTSEQISDRMSDSSSSLSSSSSASLLRGIENEQREEDEQGSDEAAEEEKKRKRAGGSDEDCRTAKRLRGENERVNHRDLNFNERPGATHSRKDQSGDEFTDQKEVERLDEYRDVVESPEHEIPHQGALRCDVTKNCVRVNRKLGQHADDIYVERTERMSTRRGNMRRSDSYSDSSRDSHAGNAKSRNYRTRSQNRNHSSMKDIERDSRIAEREKAWTRDSSWDQRGADLSSSESSHSPRRSRHRLYRRRRRYPRCRSDSRGYSESPRRYRRTRDKSDHYYRRDKYYSDNSSGSVSSYSQSPYSHRRRAPLSSKEYRRRDVRSRHWHSSEDDKDYSSGRRNSARERWEKRQYMREYSYRRDESFSPSRRRQNYKESDNDYRRVGRDARRGDVRGRGDASGLVKEDAHGRGDGYWTDDDWRDSHLPHRKGQHRSVSRERHSYQRRSSPVERGRPRKLMRYPVHEMDEGRERRYRDASRGGHSDRE